MKFGISVIVRGDAAGPATFDAMAAASIFYNSAGVDTSRARVIPLDSFVHFLDHFQKENRWSHRDRFR